MPVKKEYANRLILQIIYALKQSSTPEDPISLDELGAIIFADYSESKGDRDKSIQRAILDFRTLFQENSELFPLREESDFKNKRNKWLLAYKQPFDETELATLLLALLQYAAQEASLQPLVEKLLSVSGAGKDSAVLNRLLDLILTENTATSGRQDEIQVLDNLRFLQASIANIDGTKGTKISFQLYGFDIEGNRVPFREGMTYIVSPIYFTVHMGRFWLLAINDSHPDDISFYPIDFMAELREVTGTEALTVPDPNWKENKKNFLAQHMNLSYDNPRWAHLRVKNTLAATTRIHNAFGTDFQLVPEVGDKLEGDDLVILVKRSPYGLINWVFANSEYVTLLLDEEVLPRRYWGDARFIKNAMQERIENFIN